MPSKNPIISTVVRVTSEECSGALDIEANTGPLYGTTMNATSFPYMYPISSPDIWYRFVGNGATTLASLCSTATTYDAEVEIYGGDVERCNATLITTTYYDASCKLQWYAPLGVVYYIRVSGWCGDGDQFGLTVTLL